MKKTAHSFISTFLVFSIILALCAPAVANDGAANGIMEEAPSWLSEIAAGFGDDSAKQQEFLEVIANMELSHMSEERVRLIADRMRPLETGEYIETLYHYEDEDEFPIVIHYSAEELAEIELSNRQFMEQLHAE